MKDRQKIHLLENFFWNIVDGILNKISLYFKLYEISNISLEEKKLDIRICCIILLLIENYNYIEKVITLINN